MKSIIRILDNQTINQIAAGEVIENPSSVIKELVENALDAEATVIQIEVEGSGRHLIRVTDNGVGMGKEDAALCFERHATSKVHKIEDLDQLTSMGFRGEALPSIASISKLRLITRPRDQEKGTLIELDSGKIQFSAEVPCTIGTTIEVSELFYNVPARRKFLKSPKSDLFEIQKIIIDLAIGNSLVHFILRSDGDKVLDLPLTTTHLERAKQLLNENIFEQMVPLEYTEGNIKLEGLLSLPNLHRPNRTGQSLFLNKRAVNSWEIAQAVLEGYSTSLPERRYPLFHLHINLPPSSFDINVHPQKKEVRFSHLFYTKDVVRKGVMQALNHVSNRSFEPIMLSNFTYETVTPKLVRPPLLVQERESPSYFEKEKLIPLPSLPLRLKIPKIIAILPYYILLEEEEGIQALDIQRAKKRIVYEKVAASFQNQAIENQMLIIPLSLKVTNEEGKYLIELLESFLRIGFMIKMITPLEFNVYSYPSFLKESEVEIVLMEIIKTAFEKKTSLSSELSLLAAKASIQHITKDGKVLSEEEANDLLHSLFSCQQSQFTPNGQPIFARIDLGKFF